MKILSFIGLLILSFYGLASQAQKTISEGTITYDISIQNKANSGKTSGGLNGAKSILYLKGGLSRTEMISALGNEITIHNGKVGNAVILKEYSGQKLMITMNKDNWEQRNKKFDGINFENTNETKVIEGYSCKKAIATLKDGSIISVYYTPDLTLMNKEYSQAFKNLPGFPMEYEFETAKSKFNYLVSAIDLSPVAASKFDFPKSGYRVTSYDDIKGGKED